MKENITHELGTGPLPAWRMLDGHTPDVSVYRRGIFPPAYDRELTINQYMEPDKAANDKAGKRQRMRTGLVASSWTTPFLK